VLHFALRSGHVLLVAAVHAGDRLRPLPNGGAHIFTSSLFVGNTYRTQADLAAAGISEGGDGPTLTVEAGATLAFQTNKDFIIINRGSRILADGRADAPITITSVSDINGTVGPEDVQQWGGIVINGFGVSNKCSYTGTRGQPGFALTANSECSIEAEGSAGDDESQYGGDNDDDDSGILRYLIVKHTGFEVAPGDELNGITFNAVGAGTVVENVEAYSTYDDGFEFFGGAVQVKNAVILYARDDSLDYSDGWVGSIDTALVIQWKTDGNRCIEGDNIGASRSDAGAPFDTAPLTEPVIRNLTCITSNTDVNTHGDSEGPLGRQGAKLRLEDSIVYGGYGVVVNGKTSNECLEIESPVSLQFAAAGESWFKNSLIACEEPAKGTLPNGDSLREWATGANPSTNGADYSFNAGSVIITDSANANVAVLEPGSFYTAATIKDAEGNTVTMTPASGKLGAVTSGDDWTAPWAFGLRANNADEPLWFAQ
jgi:hypothetical protein